MKLSKKSHENIKEAIKKAELKSSGEIIPVIISASDMYPGAHFRAALFGGFILSLLTYVFYDFDDPIYLLWSQIPGMLMGYFLAFVPFVKRLLSTQKEMQEETYQRALQLYFENRVSYTKDRTGILIFISLLEKKVHMICDTGINDVVGDGFWNEVVTNLIEQIKRKNIIEGTIEAISVCGDKLEASFPRSLDDENELFDDLITDLKEV